MGTGLIQYVEEAIADVEAGRVELPDGLLSIGGFCGLKTRKFIHRLCRSPIRSYLEIGVLHGATLSAAIAGNPHLRAVGIDNFSQFDGKAADTRRNIERFGDAELLVGDAFDVRAGRIGRFDVFFYDGDHSAEATERALRHFRTALEPTALVLVDDYNWPSVQEGVERAELEPLKTWRLGEGRENDAGGYWNGMWIACVR